MYYCLPYLISYLKFSKNGVLIFKGVLSSVWYQTPKTRSESCENKFVSVRPKYLSDRGKIYIFRNSSPRAILRIFFQIFRFFAIARPGWKLVTLTLTALFNNTRTLKLKAQRDKYVFRCRQSSVRRVLPAYDYCRTLCVVWTVHNDLITARSAHG